MAAGAVVVGLTILAQVTMESCLLGIVSISMGLLFFTYCFIKVASKAVLFYLLLIQVKFFV